MKKSLLLTLGILLVASSAFADKFIVAGYKHDPTNLAARVHPRKDNNDETCGLVLVRTGIINLGVVTGGGTGVAGSVDFKDGYYWVYLSPGTRRISFYKEGFERLNYPLPEPVKSEATYILTLRSRSTGNSTAGNTMGFVVINSQPTGADVYINDSATGMQTPFQNYYREGYYRFTLKKPFYEDYTGSFEITRRKTTRDSITLVPDFGSLRLSFMPSNGVSVNIDGLISTQDSPYSIGKLKPGTHTLVLNKATYDEYRQNFTIKKGQTTSLSISLVPDFGGFTVSTTPEIHAKVNIDGIDYEGSTPLTFPKLAPGKHSLRLTKEMYLPEQQSFTISKGKSTQLILTMKPNFSTVNILAGEGDKIFIDNQQVGTGNYSGRLLRGAHIIRVEHKNYYAQSKQIQVAPGNNSDENFNLKPKTGTLSLMTEPIGADILLNNKPMGKSPRFIDSLMVGPYTVKLVKQGYATDEKQVVITENQTTTINETLPSDQDVLMLSEPPGAKLYVDGDYKGVTPMTIDLSFEKHSFKLQKENYKDFLVERSLTPTDYDLDFKMRSKYRNDFTSVKATNLKTQSELPKTITTSIGNIKLELVKGGTFQMGSNDGDYDDKPVHSVTLSSYYIGKYEVTHKQWKAIMGKNPSYFRGRNSPIERVSWNDVQEFLRKLNQITGKHYRLPTEAEWEYAARGGDKSSGCKYSGSDNYNLYRVAWYKSNSGNQTHPVGQKAPNELSIYDMSGNVYEWCSDWYGYNYYSHSSETNPRGPTSGTDRIARGGSWTSAAHYCRVTYRTEANPDFTKNNLGFRVALSAP